MGITNRTHAGRKRNRDRTSYENTGRGRREGSSVRNGIPERLFRDSASWTLVVATCIVRVGRN